MLSIYSLSSPFCSLRSHQPSSLKSLASLFIPIAPLCLKKTSNSHLSNQTAAKMFSPTAILTSLAPLTLAALVPSAESAYEIPFTETKGVSLATVDVNST